MLTRILFVDDEPGIRRTLAPILERHGFAVTTAATVRDALEFINRQAFDVLLSDLNIGEPGDGFTVVSAMRRVQPEARTFILTGYPDFETALQAIRGQVDDYLLKPTDVPTLLRAIRSKLERRRLRIPEPPMKKVSELLRENAQEIARQWLRETNSHPEMKALPLTEEEKMDYIPRLIDMLADRVDAGMQQGPEVFEAIGSEHGRQRAEQGYTIPMILVEMRLLQRATSYVLQRNLIRMDLSSVISDMLEVGEGMHEHLEYSIRSFQQQRSSEAA